MKKMITPIALLTTALMLVACSSQPKVPDEQVAVKVEDSKPGAVAVDTPQVAPVTAITLDGNDIAQLKDPKSILSKRSVFFDFDQYIIKDEFKPLVEAHGRFLEHNAKLKVLLQGNADERGSREYNLALGQKRAEATKKALQLLGAREDQVEAVSLGEEKPRCTEHSEACWAENRRVDMLYTGEF